ncbi:MAG TPA: DUF1638 domain-containing protein [Tepidisphaeraceae bacterium]
MAKTVETSRQGGLPRLAVLTCAVMESEVGHFAKGLDHIVHIEMMEQGLHNEPDKLRVKLQEMIDRIEMREDVEAIALGYGLCSRGTEGIRTRRCKLVMARAHDCITLLLGSKERYAEYVAEHPGTYWYSPGWNRHHIPPGRQRYELLLKKYTDEYGADNAEFLMESEQHWFTTYERASYVDLGVGATPEDVAYTQECADWLKWRFDHQHGDPTLLMALLKCQWDEERFVVLQPGEVFQMTADERVIQPTIDGKPLSAYAGHQVANFQV